MTADPQSNQVPYEHNPDAQPLCQVLKVQTTSNRNYKTSNATETTLNRNVSQVYSESTQFRSLQGNYPH